MRVVDLVGGALSNSGGLTFDLLAYFNVADPAPLANPVIADIGSLTPVEIDGSLNIASGVLTNTVQATPAGGDLAIYSTVKSNRVVGKAIYVKVTPNALNTYPMIGWTPNLSGSDLNLEGSVRIELALGANDSNGYVPLGRTLTVSTPYEFWIPLLSNGAYLIGKGGVLSVPTMLWSFLVGSASAQVAALITYYNGIATVDTFSIVDLSPELTNFILKNNKTSFEQSFGVELFANANFATWSGDNPGSFTVYNEIGATREVTERDPSQVHANTKTTGGAANIFDNTATAVGISQNVAITNKIYQMEVDVTGHATGAVSTYFGGGDPPTYLMSAGTGLRRFLGRSLTGGSTWPMYGSSLDVTADRVSFKEITLNNSINTVSDGEFEVVFPSPGSPAAGETMGIEYRIPVAGEELYNGWEAYIRRHDTLAQWDFRLDSIVNGTRTNRINVANVGNVTRIRVRAVGNDHDCWTYAGAWTKRGSTVNNITHSTATTANALYTSSFAPTSFTARAANLSTIEGLLAKP